jgi:hypothetical protein
VSNTANPEQLKRNVIETAEPFRIDHVTIELEKPDVSCLHTCD